MERCAKEVVGINIGVDYELALSNWTQEEEAGELFKEIMEMIG